jgi:ornithine cyclodeaminase/alanine dehydrogenase-like protein (mu-crystallin family)
LPVGGDPVEQVAKPQFEVVVGCQTVESTTVAECFLDLQLVPLFLSESDVDELIEPRAAVDAIDACFQRMAAGEVEIAPRRRLRLPEGALADMAAADSALGLAGGKLYAATANGATFVVCLFDSESSELVAVIEADRLGQLRTGAASGVAARHLAKADARMLGVIGCGYQAETQVACIRAAVPTIERVVAYCRTPEKLAAFCETVGAEPGESHRDAAAGDVVVTITSSRDPVLRGEWLAPGTLVAAAGANVVNRRELDNAVLERARFVCCDWLEQAKLESGDLVEPVHAGVLDWLEVHELHEVVSGEIAGRQSDDDIVLFKSNGLAAWDVALGAEAVRLARERGIGTSI